jgi:high-affinity iron transporter
VVLPVILALFWRLARRISWRPFFALTSILLFYVSFAFIGKGIRDLHQGGILSLTVLPEWPQLDALGIFPSVETLLLQLTLLVLVFYRVVKTHTISEQQGTSEQHLANSERVTAASVANID